MARVIDESFEGTGYEETWTESVGSGHTANEDSSGPGTLPAGGGTQCLQIIKGSGTDAVIAQRDYGSGIAIAYLRVYLYIHAEGIASDGSLDHIIACGEQVWSNGSNAFGIKLLKSGSQLQLQGNYRSSAGWVNMTAANIATGTWYRVEGLVDSTNGICEWRLDGAQIQRVTGITWEADRVPVRYFILGPAYAGVSSATLTAYYDLFAVDDADWVGAEASGSTPLTFSATDAAGSGADSLAGCRAMNAAATDDLNA